MYKKTSGYIVGEARDYLDELGTEALLNQNIYSLLVNAYEAGYKKCEEDNRDDD